jgi:hypothetical protein
MKEALTLALEASCNGMPAYEGPLSKTQRKEPKQEPVAWMDRDGDLYKKLPSDDWHPPHTPLYTTPPQRTWVGLTDEEIWKDDAIMAANSGYGATFDTLRDIVRAIEAKLKEKNT